MAISRFAASRVTQGLPKYQSAWDFDNVAQGALEPIVSSTLGTNGVFVITNIPQGYRDLRIVLSARSALSSTDVLAFWFNVYGAANLSMTRLRGDGSSATSTRELPGPYITSSSLLPISTSTVNIYGAYTIDVFGYSSTTTNKTFLMRGAADLNGSGDSFIGLGLFATTTPVTTMNIFPSVGAQQFAPGTSITLYGIKAGA